MGVRSQRGWGVFRWWRLVVGEWGNWCVHGRSEAGRLWFWCGVLDALSLGGDFWLEWTARQWGCSRGAQLAVLPAGMAAMVEIAVQWVVRSACNFGVSQ